MKTALKVLLGLGALGLLLGGCGSSSEDTTAAASAMTRSAFIKKADQVCSKGNSKQSSTVQEYLETKPKVPQGVNPEALLIVNVVLPNIRETLEALGELTPPEGDEAAVQAIIEADEKAVEAAQKDPSVVMVSQSESPFKEGTRLSKAYGFKVCGQY